MRQSDSLNIKVYLRRFFAEKVDPAERRAFVRSGLSDCSVLDLLTYNGSNTVFVDHLISTLTVFGEAQPGVPALAALLDGLRDSVGVDQQARINVMYHSLCNTREHTYALTYIVEDPFHEETVKRRIERGISWLRRFDVEVVKL